CLLMVLYFIILNHSGQTNLNAFQMIWEVCMKSDSRRKKKTRSLLLSLILCYFIFLVLVVFIPSLADVGTSKSDSANVDAAVDASSSAKAEQSIWQWIEEHGVLISLLGTLVIALIGGFFLLLSKNKELRLKVENIRELTLEEERAKLQAADEQRQNEKKKVLKTEEDRYLDYIISKNEKLAFHGFETKVRVPILLWDVYVPLRANLAGLRLENKETDVQRMHKGDETRDVSIEEAVRLAGDRHYDGLIILGDPGAGKTTLLKYFALTFAKKEAAQRLNIGGDLLPILIPLRNVDIEKSFLQNICRQLEGLDLGLSEEFFKEKLDKGHAIVLLDGLDEVADEAARKAMCLWIDNAWVRFRKCRFIITSRFAGYRGDVRLPGTYLELNMQDFSLKDVQQFLHSWYKAVEVALNEDSNYWRTQARNAAEELYKRIEGNPTYQKLAINPLMLQLIALVHYDYKTVPDRRVELYQKCIDLLLQKWDEAKGMKTLLTAKEARQVLQPLALWLHSEENRRQATYNEILKQMRPHVQSVKPGVEVEKVLISMRDRSGVFVGFGTEVYGFQHHSFQEYLTAEQIRNNNDVATLVDHFDESWWRETTLLAMGLDNPSMFAAFMSAYLNSAKSNGATADFMVRCVHEALVKKEAPLVKVLQNREQNWQTRYNALLGLEVIGSEIAQEAVKTVLDDKEPRIAEKAFNVALAWGLVKVEEEKAEIDRKTGLALRFFSEVEKQAEYILVPGGEYVMGALQNKVRVEPFYLAKFTVTNRLYRLFLHEKKYRKPPYWNDKRFNGDDQPVVGVSWDDANAYCDWLKHKNKKGGKFRLPSEAEWEWAAGRAERTYPWGEKEPTPERANYAGKVGQTTKVGNYPAGATLDGLMDMAGNVWEWCEDWSDEQDKRFRVLRGGSWASAADELSCSNRDGSNQEDCYKNFGFRVVRV
ncbi:NACHT domain-containing protein, partial [candidate division KSB1 bacterium]